MQNAKLAIDPLWQALCPSWTRATAVRASFTLPVRKRPGIPCLNETAVSGRSQRRLTSATHSTHAPTDPQYGRWNSSDGASKPHAIAARQGDPAQRRAHPLEVQQLEELGRLRHESVPFLYTRLRALAIGGNVKSCRQVAELIVKDKGEKPSAQLYSALILSNISADAGGAWRVSDYLDEMRECGLTPDAGVCHAVLKVLSVHVDHLLRADVLEYMRGRWFHLSEEGEHDVAAGLLREGLLEQGLERIEGMRRSGVPVQGWLLDMAVYILCAAGEVEEAYRIMRLRHDGGEINISRTLWQSLLDAGSAQRHHASASLIWNSQVEPGYLNPSSGICLNVLTTASQAGDAVLATDVFTHLSKRGTQFQRIHYQLLLECYLAASSPPDIKRALSILTIMAIERIEPSLMETRELFSLLRHNPELTAEAFAILRELHGQGRKIPIAALNLIIEAYVQQRNLDEAIKVYKLIHTFVPLAEGTRKSFANIETFNLLLRGCRMANPPDERQASFLVSELLALKVRPTVLTYDRLILVFIEGSIRACKASESASDIAERRFNHEKGVQLLDWAFRHFTDMQAVSSTSPDRDHTDSKLGWIPRFGTLERLATQLAKVGDGRCWDVLQAGEDHAAAIEGWEAKGKWARTNVEEAWDRAQTKEEQNMIEPDQEPNSSFSAASIA